MYFPVLMIRAQKESLLRCVLIYNVDYNFILVPMGRAAVMCTGENHSQMTLQPGFHDSVPGSDTLLEGAAPVLISTKILHQNCNSTVY